MGEIIKLREAVMLVWETVKTTMEQDVAECPYVTIVTGTAIKNRLWRGAPLARGSPFVVISYHLRSVSSTYHMPRSDIPPSPQPTPGKCTTEFFIRPAPYFLLKYT